MNTTAKLKAIIWILYLNLGDKAMQITPIMPKRDEYIKTTGTAIGP